MRPTLTMAWISSFLTAILVVTAIISDLFGHPLATPNGLLYNGILFLPILVALLHAINTLTPFRGIMFFITAVCFGFGIEILGITYGVFGGLYTYAPQPLSLFGIPLIISLYWFFFLYLGYSITNISFRNKHTTTPATLREILPLIAYDTFTVVAIDLAMDPLHVFAGHWTWLTPGIYFGVPVGNFFGWAFFTALFMLCIRWADIKFPTAQKSDMSATTLPLVIYATVGFLFVWTALRLGIFHTALFGLLAMLLAVAGSLRNAYLK